MVEQFRWLKIRDDIDEGNVEDVMQFYDLSELKTKLRVYARKCSELADAVDKLMREAGRK